MVFEVLDKNEEKNMKQNEELVNNIRKICTKKGLSVSKVEEELGFSHGLISRWTKMSPSIAKVVAVADYLGVSLDELLGRQGEVKEEYFEQQLCKATEEGEIVWYPYGVKESLGHSWRRLDEWENQNLVCGYCKYGESFFLLECELDQDEMVENLRLAILPDEKSVPVLQDVETEELLELYELVHEEIRCHADKARADQIKEAFIKDRRKTLK